MSTPSSREKPPEEILHFLSVSRMARLLEKAGFVVQVLRADDGKPGIRFLKLGIDGMASFFGGIDNDQYRIVVLNAVLPGIMPAERVNGLNSRGVLPKIYVAASDTVVELCIPLEAGLTSQAVAYYVQSFEVLLRNL
jgi:hypothetical protein